MTGKRVPLQCGHEGEYVCGQYIECPTCDAEWEEITKPLPCPHFEFYTTLVEHWTPWFGMIKQPKDFCVACGAELLDTLGKVKVTL